MATDDRIGVIIGRGEISRQTLKIMVVCLSTLQQKNVGLVAREV
jgi:hypothetical protein